MDSKHSHRELLQQRLRFELLSRFDYLEKIVDDYDLTSKEKSEFYQKLTHLKKDTADYFPELPLDLEEDEEDEEEYRIDDK